MSKRRVPTRRESLRLANRLRQKLIGHALPIHDVVLFGSIAKGKPHAWSDIDIAVICDPFKKTKHDENMEIREARRAIDIRISPICLHPDDLNNKYSTIVQEIKKYGISIQ